MKRNGHMMRANTPLSGARQRKSSFKGLRNKHWREHPIFKANSYPPEIIAYRAEPLIVIHPIRDRRRRNREIELAQMAMTSPKVFQAALTNAASSILKAFDHKRVIPRLFIPRRSTP